MARRRKKEPEQDRRTLQICYVCSHKIKGEPVRVGASAAHPDGLYRHIRCVPGGARWLTSKVGKASALREFYESEKGGEE